MARQHWWCGRIGWMQFVLQCTWLAVTKSLSGRGFRHERKPETNEFHSIAMWDSSGLSLTPYDPCMVHLPTSIWIYHTWIVWVLLYNFFWLDGQSEDWRTSRLLHRCLESANVELAGNLYKLIFLENNRTKKLIMIWIIQTSLKCVPHMALFNALSLNPKWTSGWNPDVVRIIWVFRCAMIRCYTGETAGIAKMRTAKGGVRGYYTPVI